MKKIAIFCLLMPLLFLSCRKQSVTPVNTIIADVNGVTTTFTYRVETSQNTSNANGYAFSIGLTAFTADSVHNQSIGVYMYGTTNIAKGGYKYYSPPGPPPPTASLLIYSTAVSDFDYTPDQTQGDPATVTITSISGSNIKGTFSGDLMGTNSRTVKITNGRFNINF